MKAKSVSQFDRMTQAPVSRLVITLSIPTVISMLITSAYNLVDTAFVGQLGNAASGAVGVVFGYMSVLQAIGFMFGNGSGSIISRLLGAKEKKQASEIASTGFFSSLVFGAAAAACSAVFLRPLVTVLGSTDTIAPYAQSYIGYILIAAPFITASFTMNNLLRYEGKAMLGMIGLGIGAVLNIAGDPILMFGCGMGIAGAGLSTCVSQIIGFFVLLSMFLRGKTQCRLSVKRISVKNIPNIAATGLPSLLRQGLNSLSTVVLNNSSAIYGDAAVAAMSIVSRVIFFTFSFALGIGQGFQPVCGFNYGAKKYGRLRDAYRFSVILAESVIIAMSAVLLLFPGSVIRLFRDDSTVIEYGTRALILQASAQLVLPFCMVTEMLLQSSGKRFGASLLSTLRNGLFFIPLLLILSDLRGFGGIQEAQPLSVILSLIPSTALAVGFFRRLPKEREQTNNSETEKSRGNMMKRNDKNCISSFEIVTLRISGMRFTAEYEIIPQGEKAEISQYRIRYSKPEQERILEKRAVIGADEALRLLNDCALLSWNGFHGAHPRGVRDGIMFSLKATVNGGVTLRAEGSENFPKRYRDFTDGLNDLLSSEKSEVTP